MTNMNVVVLREFLRKKIIGKEVAFEKVAVGRNWKEFGRIYFAGGAFK